MQPKRRLDERKGRDAPATIVFSLGATWVAMLGLGTIVTTLLRQERSDVQSQNPPIPTRSGTNGQDLIPDVLKRWQKDTERAYAKSNLRVAFAPWSEINTPALQRMFPSIRFFTVAWSEFTTKNSPKGICGLGHDIGATFGAHRETNRMMMFPHSGDYEAFGELLNVQGVRIKTPDDARKVWDAFCDLHQHEWRDQGDEQINERRWHLGRITIDDFHYYYDVLVGEDGIVEGAKLKADRVK